MLKKLTNKKGFTLMEMLIVVAIIAVLVAIAIPTFTGQIEKANQAADAANIRAAYAEAALKALENDGTGSADTASVMKSGSWDKLTDTKEIGGVAVTAINKTKGSQMTVTITNGAAPTFTVKTAGTGNGG